MKSLKIRNHLKTEYFLVLSGIWVQVFGFSYLGLVIWVQLFGFRYLGLGIWVQVFGFRYLLPRYVQFNVSLVQDVYLHNAPLFPYSFLVTAWRLTVVIQLYLPAEQEWSVSVSNVFKCIVDSFIFCWRKSLQTKEHFSSIHFKNPELAIIVYLTLLVTFDTFTGTEIENLTTIYYIYLTWHQFMKYSKENKEHSVHIFSVKDNSV